MDKPAGAWNTWNLAEIEGAIQATQELTLEQEFRNKEFREALEERKRERPLFRQLAQSFFLIGIAQGRKPV